MAVPQIHPFRICAGMVDGYGTNVIGMFKMLGPSLPLLLGVRRRVDGRSAWRLRCACFHVVLSHARAVGRICGAVPAGEWPPLFVGSPGPYAVMVRAREVAA